MIQIASLFQKVLFSFLVLVFVTGCQQTDSLSVSAIGEALANILPRSRSTMRTRPQNNEYNYEIESKKIVGAIEKKEFTQTEQLLDIARKTDSYDREGNSTYSTLLLNVSGELKTDKSMMTLLDTWVTEKTDSKHSHLVRGMFLINYAWVARGSGYASEVTEEGWKLFKERMILARSDLEHSSQLDPNDPTPLASLITVGKASGATDAEMNGYLQRAQKADPTDWAAHWNMLAYLEPRWGGTIEKMMAFARKNAAAYPDSRLALLIPSAHSKVHGELQRLGKKGDAKKYFKKKEVWTEIKTAISRYLKSYPHSSTGHNYMAWYAVEAGDKAIAKIALAEANKDWCDWCWNNNRTRFDSLLAEYGIEIGGSEEDRLRAYTYKNDWKSVKKMGKGVLPKLAKIYSETKSEDHRASIAYVFYTLGWQSEEAKQAMMKDVHTEHKNLRLQVQWALGRVSNDDAIVDVLLSNMQNDNNPLFRDKAACALASDQIHLTEKQKIRLYAGLIDSLNDPKEQVRNIAITALKIHTGQTKGFSAKAPSGQRSERVQEWKNWLKEYESNIL